MKDAYIYCLALTFKDEPMVCVEEMAKENVHF